MQTKPRQNFKANVNNRGESEWLLVKFQFSYLLGELTGLVWTVQDLVVKHGEVESQTQSDRMSWLHFGLADLKSVLVSFLRVINDS